MISLWLFLYFRVTEVLMVCRDLLDQLVPWVHLGPQDFQDNREPRFFYYYNSLFLNKYETLIPNWCLSFFASFNLFSGQWIQIALISCFIFSTSSSEFTQGKQMNEHVGHRSTDLYLIEYEIASLSLTLLLHLDIIFYEVDKDFSHLFTILYF